MALGMTYEDYWYGDCFKARYFIQADKERQERINETAWLYGLYTLKALEATVGNLFVKNKSQLHEYPKQPFNSEERKTEEQKQKEQEAERARLVAYLNRVAKARKDQE